MSTLELENIKHPDNSGNNLTLAADGSLGATTFTGGALNVNNTSLTLKSQGESGPFMYRAGGSGNDVRFYAANGTIASPTAKTNGQNVGQIHFHPHDGTNYRQVGSILAYMAGNASTNNTPVGLKFYTGSTTNNLSMTINENGHVTTPSQPGFQFWNNGSDFAISAGGKVTCFYAGDHNTGGHFNSSNQRFTAPVSGHYLFGGHLRIGAPGKIRVARFQIYLNGSRLRDLMSVGGTNDYDGSTGYDHPGASGTAVQYLSAGDYVEMYVDSELSSNSTVYIQGGSNDNRRSYWFGHLLG